MERTENNFFVLIVSAMMFAGAVVVLLFCLKGIETTVKAQQETLTDETLFETVNGETVEAVSTDYILSMLMSELQYDVRIFLKNGEVFSYPAGAIGLITGEMPMLPVAWFRICYGYSRYGKIQTVVFEEL